MTGERQKPGQASGMPDNALVGRSMDEPRVFAELFDRYGSALLRYARYRIGVDVANDLVAEVFANAFEQRHRFDPAASSAGPWLYGIASRLISNHRRAELRAYRALARLWSHEPTEPFTERVEDAVVAHGAEPGLVAALTGMPRRDRDVLLLIAWAELSYEETAEALDIPLGTVRSRLHRARKVARAALNGHDPRTLTEESNDG